MASHRYEQRLHVFGYHVATAEQQRMCLGCAQQGQAGARRQSHAYARMLAAAGQQCLHVVHQRVADMHLADGLAQCAYLGVVQLGHRAGDQVAAIAAAQQLTFRLRAGVTHRQPQQEAIKLRIGQRERTRQIHRVLRGDHEERIRQGMGLTVEGDLLLGHRFQQGALRARRRPVDFVGQQHVGEDRPGMELELAAAGVVDRYAEYVGRQQVGGELHAQEAQPQAAGQGMGQCGLAETGQVFDQQMAAREQGHEG
ncbi:hypothetical protein D3C72_1369980 [compost metagenome]